MNSITPRRLLKPGQTLLFITNEEEFDLTEQYKTSTDTLEVIAEKVFKTEVDGVNCNLANSPQYEELRGPYPCELMITDSRDSLASVRKVFTVGPEIPECTHEGGHKFVPGSPEIRVSLRGDGVLTCHVCRHCGLCCEGDTWTENWLGSQEPVATERYFFPEKE